MNAGPPEDEPTSEDEWEPVFPWERVGAFLRSTTRGRFVTYNALLFVLVGVSFGVPAVLQYLFGTFDGSGNVITIGVPLEQVLLGALYQAVALTPILAVVSGVVAGIYLRESSPTVAVTSALGVTAGVGGLLLLLFGTTLLLGSSIEPRPIAGGGIAGPFTVWVGATLSGGGSAYLTSAFRPEFLEE